MSKARHSAAISAAAVALGAALFANCTSDCTNVETQIGDVCLPDSLAPNLQSVLDVRESCGSDCAQFPSCTAVLLSGALYLTLREDQCSTSVSACIATQCNHNVVSCTLPALGVGDYPVVVSGGGPESVLHVRPQGTSACHLPQFPDAGTDAGDDGGVDAGDDAGIGAADAGADGGS